MIMYVEEWHISKEKSGILAGEMSGISEERRVSYQQKEEWHISRENSGISAERRVA